MLLGRLRQRRGHIDDDKAPGISNAVAISTGYSIPGGNDVPNAARFYREESNKARKLVEPSRGEGLIPAVKSLKNQRWRSKRRTDDGCGVTPCSDHAFTPNQAIAPPGEAR